LLSIPAARPAKCIGVESNFATLQLGQVDAQKMGWRRSRAGVLSTVLENTDSPPVLSVVNPKGSEYEVKVNARTGAIVATLVGG